jgi:hypothetical protein
MADAQNKPIQIVPDPQGQPAPAEDPAAKQAGSPRGTRGRRAATVLGIALVGSLAGNGFQYVKGDALQSELSAVTQDRAAVMAERDALSVALVETQEELLQSKGALSLVHTGLTRVRDQVNVLTELTAPLAGLEPAPATEEPIAADAIAPSDRLAAVERSASALPEPTSAEGEPVTPESEAVASEVATEASESTEPVTEASETLDETVTAALSTPVDSASEELAAAEGFVTEPVEAVPATQETQAAAASEAITEAAEETPDALAATSAEPAESPPIEFETAAAESESAPVAAGQTEDAQSPVAAGETEDAQSPVAAGETEDAQSPVALPPSQGSFFDRAVERVRSWF